MKHKFMLAVVVLTIVGVATYVKRVAMAFNGIFGYLNRQMEV